MINIGVNSSTSLLVSVPVLQPVLPLLGYSVAYLPCPSEVSVWLLKGHERLLPENSPEHLGILLLDRLDRPASSYSWCSGTLLFPCFLPFSFSCWSLLFFQIIFCSPALFPYTCSPPSSFSSGCPQTAFYRSPSGFSFVAVWASWGPAPTVFFCDGTSCVRFTAFKECSWMRQAATFQSSLINFISRPKSNLTVLKALKEKINCDW